MHQIGLMAKKGSIVKLKIVIQKLQRSLSGKKLAANPNVPGDVKEGHFAVIAANDDEQRRFIVPLSYLAQPEFLRLLESAAEEYGFDHKGALTIPCQPCELERLIADQSRIMRESDSAGGDDWSSYKAAIRSC